MDNRESSKQYNRTQVFLAACIGLFVFGMTLITLGAILPQLKTRFTGNEIDAGLLAAILPIGILFGSLIFGPIVDRYGYKLLLIVSVLISAIALGGLAIASSPGLLYLFIFFIGFGGGIINGGTSSLVADISSENKGANLSLLGVSFGVGALGMPLLLGILLKQYSYTVILSGVSIIMIIPVILYFFIKFPAPKQPQGFPLKQGFALMKEKVLLLTSFFLFFQSGLESLINNWTTSYLAVKLDLSDEKALYALSFSLVGLTVARLALGGILKKISSFVVMIISLFLVILGGIIMLNTNSYESAVIALIICGVGVAGGFPVIMGYVGQLYPLLSGTAFSISLVIALVGNMIINYGFGYIVKEHSILYQPMAIIICTSCMIVLMVVIKQKLTGKVKF